MDKERWKEIEGHKGYFVSSFGRIKNSKGRILKGSDNGHGYFAVTFAGDKKKAYIHRLVATAFVENPDKKPCVNHLDADPKNNRADNLEWCTHTENMRWSIKLGRMKRTERWLNHLHNSQRTSYKPVKATNIKTGEVILFERLNDVKKAGFQPSCVCFCCQGKRGMTQHLGYRWEYAI